MLNPKKTTDMEEHLLRDPVNVASIRRISEDDSPEPFYLKVLYFLGGSIPIKSHVTRCSICSFYCSRVYSLFLLLCYIVLLIDCLRFRHTLLGVTYRLSLYLFGLGLQISVSMSRKSFKKRIAEKPNSTVSINAKRGVVGTVLLAAMVELILLSSKVNAQVVGLILSASFSSNIFVVIIRNTFLVNGTETQTVLTLLENHESAKILELLPKVAKNIEMLSKEFIQTDIGVILLLGLTNIISLVGLIYTKHGEKFRDFPTINPVEKFLPFYVFLSIIVPLWLLTR